MENKAEDVVCRTSNCFGKLLSVLSFQCKVLRPDASAQAVGSDGHDPTHRRQRGSPECNRNHGDSEERDEAAGRPKTRPRTGKRRERTRRPADAASGHVHPARNAEPASVRTHRHEDAKPSSAHTCPAESIGPNPVRSRRPGDVHPAGGSTRGPEDASMRQEPAETKTTRNHPIRQRPTRSTETPGPSVDDLPHTDGALCTTPRQNLPSTCRDMTKVRVEPGPTPKSLPSVHEETFNGFCPTLPLRDEGTSSPGVATAERCIQHELCQTDRVPQRSQATQTDAVSDAFRARLAAARKRAASAFTAAPDPDSTGGQTLHQRSALPPHETNSHGPVLGRGRPDSPLAKNPVAHNATQTLPFFTGESKSLLFSFLSGPLPLNSRNHQNKFGLVQFKLMLVSC